MLTLSVIVDDETSEERKIYQHSKKIIDRITVSLLSQGKTIEKQYILNYHIVGKIVNFYKKNDIKTWRIHVDHLT